MSNSVKTHHACSKCDSSDGATTYKDGRTHCFVCKATYRADQELINQSVFDVMDSHRLPTGSNQPKIVLLPHGKFHAIESRKISVETCKKYDYQAGFYRERLSHFAYVRDQKGQVVGCHVRIVEPKGFRWVGQSKDVQLFGQHLGCKGTLVLTEGELDCMSVHEACVDEVTAVSITSGIGSVQKGIITNLKWISAFDRVVILFDSDEPGRKAAGDAADLIGFKACIGTIPGHKDASDAWVAGDGAAIKRAIEQARPASFDWLTRGSDLDLSSMPEMGGQPIPTSWKSWNDATNGGIRPGQIWLIGAATGVGKSCLTRSLALSIAQQQIPVLFIPTEELEHETALRMASEVIGEPLHLKSRDQRILCGAAIKDAQSQFLPHVSFVRATDGCDMDELTSRIRTGVMQSKAKVVFIDHLHSLISSAPLSGDERRFIDALMERLRHLANELDVAMVLACQLSQKSKASDAPPSVADIKGSGSIAQAAHFVFMLHRADGDSVAAVRMAKNRLTGLCSDLYPLVLDNQRLRELKHENDLNQIGGNDAGGP